MIQESVTNFLDSFPRDANVRIAVSGLAFCELNPELSKINFLRHPRHHDLKLDIFKRKNRTDAPVHIQSFEFPEKSRITITSDVAAPSDIFAPVGSGEFELKRLLNLQTLHGKPLQINTSHLFKPPTILSIYRCAFYTMEETEELFDLKEMPAGKPVFEKQRIGYSMGGKMNCRSGGMTLVMIDGIEPISLPQKKDGEKWLYDIVFNNHCEDEEKCEKLMMKDTDFRFYYEVLHEQGNPDRKFKLTNSSKLLNGKVAACNVVIIEPPI